MAYKLDTKTAIAIGLAAILGDTLFVVTGIPVEQAGTSSLLAYIIVGAAAILIASALGELSSLMPNEKGVAYSYVRKAFGTELGFITGILLYLAYCTTISAVSFSFGGYFISMLGLGSNTAYQIAVAAVLIIGLSLLNVRGITGTARHSKLLVFITILTAAVFIAYTFLHGFGSNPRLIYSASSGTASDFAKAMTTIVFAYAGFQVLTGLTADTKGKGKAIGKAMVYAITISMVVYLALTAGIMVVSPPTSVLLSPNPLSAILSYINAPQSVILLLDLGILVAIATATLAIILTASRLLYQIGSDGLLPKITRGFHEETGAAVNGIWISALIEIVLLFSGNIYTILSISNFGIIFSWLMACFALINMRRRRLRGRFKQPYYPYLSLLAIAASILFIFGLPSYVLAGGVTLILLLLVIYNMIVEIKYREVPRVRLFE